MSLTDATPKVIHQIWNDRNVPSQLQSFVASIRARQPDYEYRLWTHAEIDALVQERTPQFVRAYSSFKTRIEQIDFARCLILHEIGGAYFDIDMVSLKSIDPLVATNRIVLGLECSEHLEQFRPRPERIICNAVMISPPRRRFWLDLLQSIVDGYRQWRWWWQRGPVYRTGPLALTSFVERLPEPDAREITILPSCAFFPMSDHWNDGHVVGGYDSISRDCDSLDQTYAIHLWSHTWLPPWVQAFNQQKRRVLSRLARPATQEGPISLE